MISLNWVKDYIDIADQDPRELADKITKAGVNIEAVVSGHIDHLVIGQIKECVPHPDSDHLHVCKLFAAHLTRERESKCLLRCRAAAFLATLKLKRAKSAARSQTA